MTDGLKIAISTAVILAGVAGAQFLNQRRLQSIDRRLGEGASVENLNALEIERLRTRVAALERKLAAKEPKEPRSSKKPEKSQ